MTVIIWNLLHSSITAMPYGYTQLENCCCCCSDGEHPWSDLEKYCRVDSLWRLSGLAEDNVTKLHEHVLTDRGLKIREIAKAVEISRNMMDGRMDPVWHIGLEKERWLSCLLTRNNRRNREITLQYSLTLFKRSRCLSVSVSFRNRWRSMNTLVHTRNQWTVETVDFTRRSCPEEGEYCPID